MKPMILFFVENIIITAIFNSISINSFKSLINHHHLITIDRFLDGHMNSIAFIFLYLIMNIDFQFIS